MHEDDKTMSTRLRWAALTMGVAMAVAPTASLAQSDDPAGDEVVKLGFITKFPVDFFFTLENAAKAWDEAHPEAEVLFAQGQSATDDAGVTNAIEDLVAQGVSGIAITPTSEAVIPALDSAIAQGVKVVLMDNDLPSWEGKTAVVATDNLAGGVLAGEWLSSVLAPGDTLAILEGVPGVPALDARVDGMLQGLGDLATEIEVVKRLPTGCAQDQGQTATDDILTSDPDVTAIYAACGPPALGAITSIANAGLSPEDVILVGFDALSDEVTAIIDGTEDASVAQFPAKIGELGIDTLFKAVSGEEVDAFVDTGTAIVTAENAAEFGS
jgi:ABC-type sugar transport system substrate-binding protein